MSRKRCKRRQVTLVDPVATAIANAGRLSLAEVKRLIAPAQAAFDKMREGVATCDDWSFVVGALMLAWTIERGGIVRGLAPQLTEADEALVAIERRACAQTGDWLAPTLYGHEVKSLRSMLHLHAFQLSQLSYREWREASQTTCNRVRGGRGRDLQVI